MYKRTSIDLHMTDGAHLLKLQQSLLEGSKAELCLLGACKCPVKVPACDSMAACKAATIGSGIITSLQNERKLCLSRLAYRRTKHTGTCKNLCFKSCLESEICSIAHAISRCR